MNAKTEIEPGLFDAAKLALAAAVLLGGIVSYYYFDGESMLLRVVGVLVALILATVIAFQSVQGKELWNFIQGSRLEMRKVVWPTRQETLQTTLTVMVFALILGIFFWMLDLFLLWVTRLLTGQGG